MFEEIAEEPISEHQVDSCMVDESSSQSYSNYSTLFGNIDSNDENEPIIDFYHQNQQTLQKAKSFTDQDLDKDIPINCDMEDEEVLPTQVSLRQVKYETLK